MWAKSGVRPQKNPHLGPWFAQPCDPQFEDRPCVKLPRNVGRPIGTLVSILISIVAHAVCVSDSSGCCTGPPVRVPEQTKKTIVSIASHDTVLLSLELRNVSLPLEERSGTDHATSRKKAPYRPGWLWRPLRSPLNVATFGTPVDGLGEEFPFPGGSCGTEEAARDGTRSPQAIGRGGGA
jgi:hypothetical protein